MTVSEATFERVALEDPDGKWELHCGWLRSKPGMTTQHNEIGRVLGFRLHQPLPLVVEVWSPRTGREDLTEKLLGYQARGDAEIWLIHPRERTLLASVRQPDGSCLERVYRGGTISPTVLPNVIIDLDELFRL